MKYSLKELKNQLANKIIGLNIDKSFVDNPAFSSSLLNILTMLNNIKGINDELTMVNEENGRITFEGYDASRRISFVLGSNDSKSFYFQMNDEPQVYSEVNTNVRTLTNQTVTINNEGKMQIIKNTANAFNNTNNDSFTDSIKSCQNMVTSTKEDYDNFGIMYELERKNYQHTIPRKISEVGPNMLTAANEAFKVGSIYFNSYDDYTQMTRNRIDTAQVVYKNKDKGIEYKSTVPLRTDCSLREMIPVSTGRADFPFPTEVNISNLTDEEYQALLAKEANPKVVKGLERYKDRRLGYSSFNNPDFILTGIETGMQRD